MPEQRFKPGDEAVAGGILTQMFDMEAGMAGRAAVAPETAGDVRQTHAEHHMRQIHGDLPRFRLAPAFARRGQKAVERHTIDMRHNELGYGQLRRDGTGRDLMGTTTPRRQACVCHAGLPRRSAAGAIPFFQVAITALVVASIVAPIVVIVFAGPVLGGSPHLALRFHDSSFP